MNPVIEVVQLSKSFRGKKAIDDVSFKVPTGHIFAFLGPNGAGKTTLIKILMNILSPDQGSARVLGENSRHLGMMQFRQIGYVAEDQQLPDWMTLPQFLSFTRSLYPTWDQDLAEELIRQFDLPGSGRLREFSKGMKVKAALVASLAYRPRLLILDEPFSGLDPLVVEEFIHGLFEMMENEQWTIFISTHQMDEVERLADWVGIIHKGQLRLNEAIECLQQRFKRVEVTLESSIEQQLDFPKTWYLPQVEGRVIRFIESEYIPKESEARIKFRMPAFSDMRVSGMSLREIFLVLAKQYQMLNL
jgi:ABC-2 type transport system ATP-binding protein